jgi:hypothetical protein
VFQFLKLAEVHAGLLSKFHCSSSVQGGFLLMVLLAHLVEMYDMKFEEGKGVACDLYITTMCIARALDVMFKTRQVKKNPSSSASHQASILYLV